MDVKFRKPHFCFKLWTFPILLRKAYAVQMFLEASKWISIYWNKLKYSGVINKHTSAEWHNRVIKD